MNLNEIIQLIVLKILRNKHLENASITLVNVLKINVSYIKKPRDWACIANCHIYKVLGSISNIRNQQRLIIMYKQFVKWGKYLNKHFTKTKKKSNKQKERYSHCETLRKTQLQTT